MIKLKESYKRKGMLLKQLFRDDEVAIYEGNNCFEVFKIIVWPKDVAHDEEYEKYPYDEVFGNWAWSCSNGSCVAKVINAHFPTHKLNERFKKYVVGSYKRNGELMPKFELSYEQLLAELTD